MTPPRRSSADSADRSQRRRANRVDGLRPFDRPPPARAGERGAAEQIRFATGFAGGEKGTSRGAQIPLNDAACVVVAVDAWNPRWAADAATWLERTKCAKTLVP
mmetsp:Transcript_922/g.2739  ORF Transcript_922/g.2739 Transcript_922/m.2739 type:complete len:104 (+) Transcript_922:222-533(+)